MSIGWKQTLPLPTMNQKKNLKAPAVATITNAILPDIATTRGTYDSAIVFTQPATANVQNHKTHDWPPGVLIKQMIRDPAMPMNPSHRDKRLPGRVCRSLKTSRRCLSNDSDRDTRAAYSKALHMTALMSRVHAGAVLRQATDLPVYAFSQLDKAARTRMQRRWPADRKPGLAHSSSPDR